MAEAQKEHARSNLLLGALETSSRERIDPHLEPITLKLGVHRLGGGGPPQARLFPGGRRPPAVNRLGERVGN